LIDEIEHSTTRTRTTTTRTTTTTTTTKRGEKIILVTQFEVLLTIKIGLDIHMKILSSFCDFERSFFRTKITNYDRMILEEMEMN
jgi:aromatic ring-opening dioxygenase LigB subunit